MHVQCQCLHFGILSFLFTSTIPIHITPLDQCLKNVQTSRNFLKFPNHHLSATLTHISTFTRMQSTFQTQMWSTKDKVDEALILFIFYKCILRRLSYSPPTTHALQSALWWPTLFSKLNIIIGVFLWGILNLIYGIWCLQGMVFEKLRLEIYCLCT